MAKENLFTDEFYHYRANGPFICRYSRKTGKFGGNITQAAFEALVKKAGQTITGKSTNVTPAKKEAVTRPNETTGKSFVPSSVKAAEASKAEEKQSKKFDFKKLLLPIGIGILAKKIFKF